jgi:hypothetical protein
MCEKLLSRLSFRSFRRRALPALLLALVPTTLSSRSSEPSSSGSAEHLMTWETLSNEFTLSLERHEQTLKELGMKLRGSEASLRRLTPLYELSLRQNESLKVYNNHIGRQVQESDEWNAELQENNIKLEADVKTAKAHGLRNAPVPTMAASRWGFSFRS